MSDTTGPSWRKSSYSGANGGNCVEVGQLGWRKSSHSGANGGQCVEVGQLGWRKSSHSSANGGQCVEVADHDGTIVVRDTKDHGHGQVHRFTPSDWRAFVASIKATERLYLWDSAAWHSKPTTLITLFPEISRNVLRGAFGPSG